MQLKQTGFQVADQQAYIVSFWAKAAAPRRVSAGLCKETADWQDISNRFMVSLSTSWQLYSQELHVDIPDGIPNPLPPQDTRFFFAHIGTELTSLWIDDVKLQTPETASYWMTCATSMGTINPGAQVVIQIFFNTGNLSNGTYQAVLSIESDDSDEPVVTVPVTLIVNSASVDHPDFTAEKGSTGGRLY